MGPWCIILPSLIRLSQVHIVSINSLVYSLWFFFKTYYRFQLTWKMGYFNFSSDLKSIVKENLHVRGLLNVTLNSSFVAIINSFLLSMSLILSIGVFVHRIPPKYSYYSPSWFWKPEWHSIQGVQSVKVLFQYT